MVSPLDAHECRYRLTTGRSGDSVARLWLARGDATYYKAGLPRYGSLLEMHVRARVVPTEAGPTTVKLRFSGGVGSALLLALTDLICVAAFGWAILSFSTAGWNPLVGAGLLSVLVPILLIFALRSAAPQDLQQLWEFVASVVDGREVE